MEKQAHFLRTINHKLNGYQWRFICFFLVVNFTAFRCVLQLMGGCYGFAFFCLLVGTWDVLDGGKISFPILSLWIVNIMYEIRRFLCSFCVFLQGDTKGSAKGGDGSAKKEAHPTPIPQVHYMSMIFFSHWAGFFGVFFWPSLFSNSIDGSSRVVFPRS